MSVTPIEPGNRIQLPAEWVAQLGATGLVALEKTADGVLVRPCPRKTWDEVFATKLVINSAPTRQQADDDEEHGDDFLF